jgi:hypothetical protein
MTLPLSRELFLAILSMDSYNRGYGTGLTFKKASTQIGKAQIITFPNNVSTGWEAAGFYALAYNMTGVAGFTSGERVISYRGTNFDYGDSVSAFFNSPLVRDALYGWTVGAGLLTSQAGLALQFYRAVVGENADRFAANVTLTGHSLGGGLAGFVGLLYGRNGVLFDNMTYELAAGIALAKAATAFSSEEIALRSLIYGDGPLALLDPSGLRALATTGEVLDVLVRPAPINLDSNGGVRSPLSLHSMALLTNLIWARDNSATITNWEFAGVPLWDAFFSTNVAEDLSSEIAPFLPDGGDRVQVLQSAIAYSALDSGERPFGDVAIRAMFDDAADFGTVLQAGLLPNWVGDKANAAIGRVIVEFAGLMALRDVEGLDPDASDANKRALGGVISLTGDAASPTSMRLRFDDALWGLGTGGVHQSHERTGLIYSAANDNASAARNAA